MEKLNINENFVSRIWENPSYYDNLKTTDGRNVAVIKLGKRNYDSGPDYKNAKINIHGVIYTGDIEIHRKLEDWKAHGHKRDGKYNKVILQVSMWDDDGDLPVAKKSRKIPTIILSKFLTSSVHSIWKDIINNPSDKFKLPCYPEGMEVESSLKNSWMEELSIERLRYKTLRLKNRLDDLSRHDKERPKWEQMLFEYICEALGYSKNKDQFLKLTRKIDVNKVKRLKLNREGTDTLMYGGAGFLKELRYKDEYISILKNNWGLLKKKFNIDPLDKSEWHFFRLRPPNFPTVRLAYASSLLYSIANEDLFKKIVLSFENEDKPVEKLFDLLSSIEVSDYWKSHYNFGKPRKTVKEDAIGKDRLNDIITNVILPVLYLYCKRYSKQELEYRILSAYFFTKKPSRNEITRVMENQLGFRIKTISQEQGMIQLHNFYCVKGKCTKCKIGKEVFKDETLYEPLKIILY